MPLFVADVVERTERRPCEGTGDGGDLVERSSTSLANPVASGALLLLPVAAAASPNGAGTDVGGGILDALSGGDGVPSDEDEVTVGGGGRWFNGALQEH